MPTQISVDPKTDEVLIAIKTLLPTVVELALAEAARMLDPYPPEFAHQMLELLNPAVAQDVLARFPSEHRQKVMAAAAPALRQQWMRNETYHENTIGRLMEPPLAVYRPETTIAAATSDLRQFSKRAFITYRWVVDDKERLLGVVVMREMLISENPAQRLDEIMIRKPFSLTPDTSLTAAMKDTGVRHFPVLPRLRWRRPSHWVTARPDAL